ncbi:transposase is3 protein [Marine Group I thaumarchaeote SCGC RSA3]|uniref:Transposase is3 protein n=2 Tax=Marine Group I TaxID=905826 RepID=A0A081RNZ8_9ARCH|nr:transposase is3 protein [Marine Group I thaumarchaeote SCGC AAA799-N04]KFM17413.1 transposase is3 protein [Marine Group I thaumarchaeote SCGC RSA3]
MRISKFTHSEKVRMVLESLNTNISTAELCRKYNISPPTFYQWKERFIEAGKASLNGRSNNDMHKNLQKENETLKRIVGELTIVNDAFKKTLEGHKK